MKPATATELQRLSEEPTNKWNGTKPKPSRFPLVSFEDLKPGAEAPYLVKGLIPREGLTVVWGPPKCGKSFWAFDLAMHIALNTPYRGRAVHGGPVVYCAFEGASGFKRRAEAFRQRFMPDDFDQVPFSLSPTPMDLVADHKALIASINAQLPMPPVAVFLDTLNRSLRGSESDDKDMSAYIRAADAIREAFGCAVIIVHHCGIDGTRPRGHTSLGGAVEAQLAVKRDSANNIVVTVEWMKDGPEGDIITSALEEVEVGIDEDGDPLTSCVIVEAEASEAKPNRRLSDKQQATWDALSEALIAHGTLAPASLGLAQETRTVEVERWREEMFARGVISEEDPNPRQDFKRLKLALAARKLIGERNNLVWTV